MAEYNCDLHFHSPHSGGVSKNMLIPVIAEQAKLKGLDVVSTSDILHAKWFEHLKQNLVESSNGIFQHEKTETYFICGTEIQCKDLVHNVILLPDFSAAENLKDALKGTGIFDSAMCGRPRIRIQSRELAAKVFDCGGILGPAHAFTPYFSIYAHFDSMEKCYGELHKKINFMELGLSADTNFADLISDNHNYQFITCSDSHSPWPNRVGREFTRIKMKEPSFKNLKKAFEEKDEKLVALNVGLDPREGKYHCTACAQCFAKYSMKDAISLKWKCTKCKGDIKKGVRDRILELKDSAPGKHPAFRPPYMHSLPLAEIIQLAVNVENPNSKKVQEIWHSFIDEFKNEINVLVDVPENELVKFNEKIGKKIIAFRNGYVLYVPGGGGAYGKPILCDSENEWKKKKQELEADLNCSASDLGQKSLFEF